MREPRTRVEFPGWLQKQALCLECLTRYGEPDDLNRQFFQDVEVKETMEEVQRVAGRFGYMVDEIPTDPHTALVVCGRLLEEVNGAPGADDLLTVTQAAKRLQVNRDKVLGWINYGRLQAVNTAKSQLGRPRWRIKKADLEDFLAGRTGQA